MALGTACGAIRATIDPGLGQVVLHGVATVGRILKGVLFPISMKRFCFGQLVRSFPAALSLLAATTRWA